jgi:molybdopterin molybdotransferase
MMLTPAEALAAVLDSLPSPDSVQRPALACPGYTLAEDVHSDIDMPPFDRSAVDGFALSGSAPVCSLLPEVFAGDSPGITVHPGEAAPIMTGAPVPAGADRIVMVEKSAVTGDRVTFSSLPDRGANICLQGEDIRAGQLVLPSGTLLGPHHLGIAAMAGRDVLSVYRKPVTSVMTTGSEVIPPSSRPGPGQVRNANLALMESLLARAGFPVCGQHHSPDEPDVLLEAVRDSLEETDFLLIAGGVSMGRRDYVPDVLRDAGTGFLFRSVAQKPGKPLLYGITSQGKPVFGLPGNPVSVLVCMEEYVLPALRKTAGFRSFLKREFTGTAGSQIRRKPGRTDFLRVRAGLRGGGWMLSIPATSGSGDLMSTSGVNALAVASGETPVIEEGEPLPFHFLSGSAGEMAFL